MLLASLVGMRSGSVGGGDGIRGLVRLVGVLCVGACSIGAAATRVRAVGVAVVGSSIGVGRSGSIGLGRVDGRLVLARVAAVLTRFAVGVASLRRSAASRV